MTLTWAGVIAVFFLGHWPASEDIKGIDKRNCFPYMCVSVNVSCMVCESICESVYP